VQYITLSPFVQITGLAAVMGLLFWTAYATINYAFKDQLMLLREQRINEARLDFDDRMAEMRAEIDKLNDALLLDQKAYLQKVDHVDAEYRRLADQHERLVNFFRDGLPWKRAPGSAAGATATPKPEKSSFNEQPFAEKYAARFANVVEAHRPLADMQDRLAALEALQIELADAAIAVSQSQVAKASSILAKLGITVAAPSTSEAATGGPFIPVSLQASSSPLDEKLATAARILASYEDVKEEIGALPVYLPMKNVSRISSTFGFRTDPFRRVPAMHAGIDFKADYASPVFAVADGVVVRAGFDGAYGRLVEIKHDNGVSTRYAHLSSISVKPGEKVERGDDIGRMGNTGRSTGPHLHFETRINGRAIDPVRFWQAFNDLQALRAKEIER
jgi:murein DD-endopeptidase MepM/ murein hydrolase activator NlpD